MVERCLGVLLVLIGLEVGSWLLLKGLSRTLWVNYLLLSLVLVMGGRERATSSRRTTQVSWGRTRGSVLVYHDQTMHCIFISCLHGLALPPSGSHDSLDISSNRGKAAETETVLAWLMSARPVEYMGMNKIQ